MTRSTTRVRTGAAVALLALGLTACGSSSHVDAPASTSSAATASTTTTATTTTAPAMTASGMTASGMTSEAMGDMDADGGPAPAGMTAASHPRHPVGSHVVLTADHEMGMKGARATVVGAYSTITYAVDYTPTTGGATVKDHKWVVQQEIRDAGTRRLADGTHVVLTASHMPGMQGARATIVSSTTQTVYMVDWDMVGMMMKNHKWVVDSEMRAAS